MPASRASAPRWKTLLRLKRRQSEYLAAEFAALCAREQQLADRIVRLETQRARLPTASAGLSIQELCRTDERRQAFDRQRQRNVDELQLLAHQSAALKQQLVDARRAVMQMERLGE